MDVGKKLLRWHDFKVGSILPAEFPQSNSEEGALYPHRNSHKHQPNKTIKTN
ncbi:hypothetical protein HanRHA438_Chr14g0679911 [Helianthus annuus]|nr:hypothetical protein HanRHA438_Chr14g0679911 [Helianthus annuus]